MFMGSFILLNIIIYIIVNKTSLNIETLTKLVQRWLMLAGVLFFFVPLISSLHRPISGDTLSFMVSFLIFLHLISYDYKSVFEDKEA